MIKYRFREFSDGHLVEAYDDENSAVAGDLWYQLVDGEAFVRAINVVPNYRGRGIGTQLCREFVDFAVDNNYMTLGEWEMDHECGFRSGNVCTIPFNERRSSFAEFVLNLINPRET